MDMGDQYDDDFYEYPDEDRMNIPDMGLPMNPPNSFGNNRYRYAYGAYRGGYGSVGGRGGFGPPRNFGPPPNFGPGPANFHDSHGSGLWPRGPPFLSRPQKSDAIKYLIKCGVPREHLRNLPRDLLRLINPDYCGLCAVELDSFSVSRVHYNSKNHLKNQKKWMNNRVEFGGQRGKMIPMKSRDLYCELCDVEITSKPHSESHYAGRSHRAIVEERKNPKNPMLLQPGMEDRVKQLIRREKKFLPPIEEAEVEDKPQVEKPTSPELYCDICKTFVTCTEQMTLHLNGKKHLNKEKQYILRMMKGDMNPNDETPKKDKGEEEDAGHGADDETEEGGDGKAADDNDDWENNGENWDEPETKI
ncbi:uncharacterized protein LOC119829955 [Zerene cesonia]|uniref:uncharacterized protein LOC119829955 n=1 Tax=Zerene cesonia TaxID=33412 RepID=UPI0018E56DE9|nr:uncharacterized protein LOC119829955 [Zerene cesonia]XP_038208630.1 uncharacterized protein LOC119829955 [Zerene cesonia]XP_038208631.1 uncharacterized protein LOC119829955 [Zerene cesonia]